LSGLDIDFRKGGRGDFAPRVKVPDLDRILNRKTSSYEFGSAFRYRLISLLLLSTKGAFIELTRSASGDIAEMHILDPSRVEPFTDDPNKYVTKYKITGSNGQGVAELDPEQVLWIKLKPHPTNIYAQMTPLAAAGITVDTDWMARLFNYKFLQNDGRPGMLITVQDLNPDDADKLSSRFSGGYGGAGRTTVIDGAGVDVADLSTNPRDAQHIETLAHTTADIMLAFGVPKSVMGDATGATFDNADAEDVGFWTNNLLNIGQTICNHFDALTPGGLDDDIYLVHDTRQIYSLQASRRERAAEMLAEVQAGVRTINSYLLETGQPEIDAPEARVLHFAAVNTITVGSKADVDAIAAVKAKLADEEATRNSEGQIAALDDADRPLQGPGFVAGRPGKRAGATLRSLARTPTSDAASRRVEQDLRAVQGEVGRLPNRSGNSRLVKRPRAHKSANQADDSESDRGCTQVHREHPYADVRATLEAQITEQVQTWSDRQIDTVVARLGHQKARKLTRHWKTDDGSQPIVTKVLSGAYVVDQQRWATDLTTTLYDVIQAAAAEEARKMVASYGMSTETIDVTAIVTAMTSMVTRNALGQSRVVEDIIEEAESHNNSLEDIKDKVRGQKTRRAKWVESFAIQLTTAVVESTRVTVAERLGSFRKTWHSQTDKKVRATHRKLHGRTIYTRNAFKVKGMSIRYPGDPDAPLSEVINCRCWLEITPI
jgi:HK97 family phage portal protein